MLIDLVLKSGSSSTLITDIEPVKTSLVSEKHGELHEFSKFLDPSYSDFKKSTAQNQLPEGGLSVSDKITNVVSSVSDEADGSAAVSSAVALKEVGVGSKGDLVKDIELLDNELALTLDPVLQKKMVDSKIVSDRSSTTIAPHLYKEGDTSVGLGAAEQNIAIKQLGQPDSESVSINAGELVQPIKEDSVILENNSQYSKSVEVTSLGERDIVLINSGLQLSVSPSLLAAVIPLKDTPAPLVIGGHQAIDIVNNAQNSDGRVYSQGVEKLLGLYDKRDFDSRLLPSVGGGDGLLKTKMVEMASKVQQVISPDLKQRLSSNTSFSAVESKVLVGPEVSHRSGAVSVGSSQVVSDGSSSFLEMVSSSDLKSLSAVQSSQLNLATVATMLNKSVDVSYEIVKEVRGASVSLETKIEDLALLVKKSALSGINNISIKLKPVELGNVEVVFKELNGDIQLQFKAEKSETVTLLQNHEGTMKQLLKNSSDFSSSNGGGNDGLGEGGSSENESIDISEPSDLSGALTLGDKSSNRALSITV